MFGKIKENRIFIICGTEFHPHTPNQLTCCKECSRIHRNRSHRKWYTENREEINENRRFSYFARTEPEPIKKLEIDFTSYDEYGKRQKAESIEKFARLNIEDQIH